MAKVDTPIETFARIKVIGVGGSGANALNHMIESKVKGGEFIVMNTDTQDLHKSLAEKKIHLGKNLTRGLGAGMNPDIGRKAAEETKAEIQDAVKGADMVFIACGMGGGTGTGASPIVAAATREQGILTVAVVTKPFLFEGAQRMRMAEKGIADLEQEVDAIIVIPNERILSVAPKDTSFKDAFAMCDEILRQAVEGISELITTPGMINVDFADIRAVMANAGSALMGIGRASGEGRAAKAAMEAINSPLLDLSISGAKGVLLAISGGDDLSIHEVSEAANIITQNVDKDAKVIFGMIRDDKLNKHEMKITLIATGFPTDMPKRVTPMSQQVNSSINSILGSDESRSNSLYDTQNSPAALANQDNNMKSNDNNIKTPDIIIDDSVSEEAGSDDWSSVPAFLRRNKR
ncbi:cell division protein FtsZ [Candidatus Nomurabacteria bacterium RIFCSPHIGHO2_02_FULL_33_12]|uniref:Cell division protein FtsZ n=1 Tax=Candidatus Nomurabacteria bacterium RIFCSPLOWO2_01_FULL_33_17 TaxID=1801764 RepID=A0A1F6WPY4_9BACT|nr:MAG: cell division protein FtsZ [Candidatus Nomurabacteria bacterium RIFCSPHIGHO2_02_FULL_33_12]OGI83943.1 MAG: cell division protein FtsZ [Candidatus Nomurabacteria bacterium RIFCSPLOWO2_01_FULL_33_17]